MMWKVSTSLMDWKKCKTWWWERKMIKELSQKFRASELKLGKISKNNGMTGKSRQWQMMTSIVWIRSERYNV